MKILVISNTPLSEENSFGNSFENIFEGLENLTFANIYCRSGKPGNNPRIRFFQITEKSLIRNLCHSSYPSGNEVLSTDIGDMNFNVNEQKGFEQASKVRWQILFWIRDLIWKVGHWKSKELMEFIADFKPDIIFQPIYFSSYINNIVFWAKNHTEIPMIGYITDDCYTLKQWKISPLYWIDRLWKRKKVKRTINQCEILYVISKIQKQEYEKIFIPPCKILTKCADFDREMPVYDRNNNTLLLLYAGNLGAGRWQSLALLAQAVEKIQKEGYDVTLQIYTGTPLNKRMQRALSHKGCELFKAVPYKKILQYQKQADILVHVEGLSKESRLKVHQSFSTKLVDYFSLAKCIFAIGTEDVASIKHLKENKAAIVGNTKETIYRELAKLVKNPEKINEYAERAWKCGRKNHNKVDIQNMLMEDLEHCIRGR